jgi:hypothetical protein
MFLDQSAAKKTEEDKVRHECSHPRVLSHITISLRHNRQKSERKSTIESQLLGNCDDRHWGCGYERAIHVSSPYLLDFLGNAHSYSWQHR